MEFAEGGAVRAIWSVLSQAVLRFIDDEAFTLGAAIAYYSLLSIAPLLLIAVSLAGAFFAYGDVRMELVDQMSRLTGPEGAALTETVIDHTKSHEASLWSLLLGAVLTLFGATTVFAQLQHALNVVWRVKAAPGNAIMSFIRQRLLSFAIVLVIGFLLMVSLLTSAVLASLHMYLDEHLAGAAIFWKLLDLAMAFGLAVLLIALMFRYLPDAEIPWRDTWLGGFITAMLFTVGKVVIGQYLGQTSIASSFGAAASVVIFMVWVYYVALILLFGAEITQAVAWQRGSRVTPSEHAKPLRA
jgi:membrane protein